MRIHSGAAARLNVMTAATRCLNLMQFQEANVSLVPQAAPRVQQTQFRDQRTV